jgi:glycosyltransferase involved in cell wall biosynthesis
MKVALVYDRINKWGGAEAVLLELHKLFPAAPLFTSVYDPKKAPWATVFKVNPSFLQKLPLPKSSHELYPFLMGPAFESFSFDEFDVVISVTAEFGKAILTKPKTLHICYCLNPTGYLWSGYEQYFSQKGTLFKRLSKPIVSYLRWYDRLTSTRPDQYIAISKTVQNRIKKYYNQESTVIYPPTILGQLENTPRENFFLVVSRLVPNKRIDLVVKTFNVLGLPLKIVGTGSELEKLKAAAKANIEFLGFASHSDKWRLLSTAKALIIPGEEDFGLTAVEAQSVGTPVIAFKKGGITETVIDGKTGFFFLEQTAESLSETIARSSLEKINSSDCRKNAEKFSTIVFNRNFLATTRSLWEVWKRKYVLRSS